MNSFSGQQINGYQVIKQVGLGGMAIVYKAYDLRKERDVAFKIIRTDEIPASQLDRLVKRFEREAKAQSSFSHPNIVPVFDYGKFEGTPYLVLEYLPGGTLKDRMKGPFPVDETLQILIPLADAVAYAHSKGVLHRDIKPSNIIFNKKDQPLLADFGIAKVLEGNEGTLTGTGLGVGTPEYMAPEQWQGKATEASDQYALGVLLYELLTGNKPFTAETPLAVALKQINEPLKRPTELVPEIPLQIENLIFKTMARDAQDRFAAVTELRDRLVLLAMEFAPQQDESVVVEEELPLESNKIDPTPVISLPLTESNSLNATEDQLGEIQPKAAGIVRVREENTNSPIPSEVDSTSAFEKESAPPFQNDAPYEKQKPAISKRMPRKKTPRKGKTTVQPKWLWLATLLLVLTGLTWGGITLLLRSDFLNNTNAQSESVNLDVTSTFTPEISATQAISVTTTFTETATETVTVTPTETYKIVTRLRDLDGMIQVFVPAGEVKLGYTSDELDELIQICNEYEAPELKEYNFTCSMLVTLDDISFVNVDGFWMDQTEVTNGMYELCRLSGACPPAVKSSYTRQVYFRDEQYANYPMMYTYWSEANAYCEWVGGRLPTFAEWKMAATGTDGRFFPWGNTPPSPSLLNYYQSGIGDSVAVGSYPDGVSPYGALDLVGNVSEWLNDSITSDTNFEDFRAIIGDNAVDGMFIHLLSPMFDMPETSMGQGFRCVMDDDWEN